MRGTYRHLIVWQKAMDLVVKLYETTDSFPDREKYGLTSQMRRAAVSIPSNIAEGKGRTGANEFPHFVSVARGSVHELETQLMIAFRLGYLKRQAADSLLAEVDEIGRMLGGLLSASRPQ